LLDSGSLDTGAELELCTELGSELVSESESLLEDSLDVCSELTTTDDTCDELVLGEPLLHCEMQEPKIAIVITTTIAVAHPYFLEPLSPPWLPVVPPLLAFPLEPPELTNEAALTVVLLYT
jgi:hypothetical protein